MRKRPRFLVAVIVLTIWAISFPGPVRAQGDEPMPGNTVILANQVDARFSRDYSALLKHLRLEWVILEGATVPDAVRGKHVILLGRLDAAHSGEILRGMMTADEVAAIRAAPGEPVVLEKESPWAEGRRVILCVGAARNRQASLPDVASRQWTVPLRVPNTRRPREYVGGSKIRPSAW